MIKNQKENTDYGTIAWGALFIWWGITELIKPFPVGLGAFGIGLILLGLNGFRGLKGIPTNSFSTTLGILALILGGMELVAPVLHLPFEIPIFAILLIVLGGIILARRRIQAQN